MASFFPSNISEEKKKELQEQFYTIVVPNKELLLEAYKEMDGFFSKPEGVNYIETYTTSYWEWYVYATWTLLQQISPEGVLRAAQRQVIDAIRLGFRVDHLLLTYMATQVLPGDDLISFYKELKKNISDSDAVVGKEGNALVPLRKVYAELKKINDNFDALAYSEFKTRVINLLKPTLPAHDYAYLPIDKMVINFMDLLNVIQVTTEDTIGVAVDQHVNPVFYQHLEKGDYRLLSAFKKVLGEPQTLKPEKFEETRKFLLENFSQDASGQFEDIDTVVDLLDKTAAIMGDERLKDLYIFNENTGQFEWNQELLNQQPA